MFPDLQTDLYDPDSVENDLRHSAKGSLDAYDVTHSLTLTSGQRKETSFIVITSILEFSSAYRKKKHSHFR